MNYPETDHRDTWEEDESGIVNELEDNQVKEIAAVLMDEIKALPVEEKRSVLCTVIFIQVIFIMMVKS